MLAKGEGKRIKRSGVITLGSNLSVIGIIVMMLTVALMQTKGAAAMLSMKGKHSSHPEVDTIHCTTESNIQIYYALL